MAAAPDQFAAVTADPTEIWNVFRQGVTSVFKQVSSHSSRALSRLIGLAHG